MSHFDVEISKIHNEKRSLLLAYVKEGLGFQIGDKVKITGRKGVRLAFIQQINLGYDNRIDFILVKAKKDGSKSKVSEYVWMNEKMELADE